MNRLPIAKRVAVISALVEGCSVRSTVRLTGVAKGTILRLLASVGTACAKYQDAAIQNVKAQRVQIDEIWSFVGAKQKNVTLDNAARGAIGDVWTFVAIEAQTKLVLSWLVGLRDAGCATDFMQDVAGRLSNRIQLTTDGHKMYLSASRMPLVATSTTRCCTRSIARMKPIRATARRSASAACRLT